MSDPITNLQNDLTVVVMSVLIGAASFGVGFMTHALMAKTKTAEAQVAAVTHSAAVASSVETQIIKTEDKATVAAQEAHHAIAAAPKPAPSPSCDYRPVLDAWRDGLDRVRQASGSGDDSAGSASVVPGTGPGGGEDAR